MKKKLLIALGVVLAILIVTNPSPKSFQGFIKGRYDPTGWGTEDGYTYKPSIYREMNFFVFSVYRYDNMSFLSIAGNFIDITSKPNPVVVKESEVIDCAYVTPPQSSFIPPKQGYIEKDKPTPVSSWEELQKLSTKKSTSDNQDGEDKKGN